MCQIITAPLPERKESPPRRVDPDRLARKFDAPANRHLQLLGWLLRTTTRVADEFLAEHPSGCSCDFCGVDRWIDGLKRDVDHAGYQAEMAAGMILSVVVEEPDLDGVTAADDLRAMAEFADRLEAAYAAEDEETETDEPLVVAAGEGGAL